MRTTGRRSPSRPSSPRIPSSVRAWRRSGAVAAAPRRPAVVEAAARSGRSRMTSGAAGPSSSASSSSAALAGPGRAPGRSGRTARRRGRPGAAAQDRHRLAERAHARDDLVEETGDPDAGRATEQERPRPAAGGIVKPGRKARERRSRAHEAHARVAGGHDGILRSASAHGWRVASDRFPRRRAPHPANTLNELPGEEWLYFTKSLLTTAYPSELGHAARRAHGANKPPRLMARLIEFFTQDRRAGPRPVRGVGGTLLGAAIARGPRRALGIELDPRWAAIYDDVVRDLRPSGTASGPASRTSARPTPGGPRRSTRRGSSCVWAMPLVVLPDARGRIGRLRRDRSAVQPATADDDGRRRLGRDARQPPHRLRDGHRLTGRPGQRRRLRGLPRSDGDGLRGARVGSCARAAMPWSSCATPTRTGATSSPGRTWRRGRRASGSSRRATSSGTRRGRGCGRTAIRGLRPQHRPPAHPGAAQGGRPSVSAAARDSR